MDTNQAATWSSEKERQKDLKKRKRAEFKHDLYMKWHGFYWRVLHLTGLAKRYSITMCSLNLYRKHLDGRCMWCGKNH